MTTLTAILIHDLETARRALRYAQTVAQTASANGNSDLASQYAGAAREIESLYPELKETTKEQHQ